MDLLIYVLFCIRYGSAVKKQANYAEKRSLVNQMVSIQMVTQNFLILFSCVIIILNVLSIKYHIGRTRNSTCYGMLFTLLFTYIVYAFLSLGDSSSRTIEVEVEPTLQLSFLQLTRYFQNHLKRRIKF
ncbi:hypothetical protein L596_008764 [Steinernema carpocapsae]|uniref:Uncharacterized protein n=1 Tax=Steinernema carpocapsae TaxID=34508 RepID=A0A4U5PDL0_STECR|nr:hypothetical protein L596_008764 [Steinernema carpocapsae]